MILSMSDTRSVEVVVELGEHVEDDLVRQLGA